MERKTGNQEPMAQMTQAMGQIPMNNLPNYPYFIPDYHSMQNYPQMAMYGNRQPMNGYQFPIDQPREEQTFPQSPTQKNQTNQKISSSNQPTTEKQKIKPYINLLITTVNNLFKEEKISLKYLNEKTEHKPNHQNTGTNNPINASNTNTNLRKASETSSLNNTYCDNIFNSNKDKYKTKIKGLKPQEKNLCKMCFEAFEKGDFCYYCNSIYRDGLVDPAKWVECDYCRGWEHFNCEIEKGKKYANMQELNDEKHYMCPVCVNKRNNQKNIDNKFQKKLINKKRRGDVFDDQKNKKNQRKDLRNLKSEKCSELLEDIELMENLPK